MANVNLYVEIVRLQLGKRNAMTVMICKMMVVIIVKLNVQNIVMNAKWVFAKHV